MTSQAKVAPRQVAAYQSLRPVVVDAAATCGAQIGVNLLLPDGSLGTVDKLRALFGSTSSTVVGSGPDTTDDLPQGQFNWYGNVYSKDVAATTYTAGQGDNNVILRGTAASGLTISVPAGDFIVGTTLYALQGDAGAVQFVAGEGVTFLPADSAQTRDQGSLIALKQTATDVWEPAGDLAYFFPATSVHANPTSADAQPVALAASAAKQVLKRIGTALQWVQQIAADVLFTPAGNLAATDVQSALVELDTEKVAYVALAANSGATPGASLVGFPPSGTLSSSKVGDALRELDAEKASIGGAETFAVAGGTADALTATFSPAITSLVAGAQLKVRASAANTSTTPTLKVNALTAYTITKNGAQALAAGDIYGAGHELLLRYVAGTTPRFELLNSASSSGGGSGGISEAPDDGNLYARKSKGWTAISGVAGGAPVQTDVDAIYVSLAPAFYWPFTSVAAGVSPDASGNGHDVSVLGTYTMPPAGKIVGGAFLRTATASAGVVNGAKLTGMAGLTTPLNYDYTVFFTLCRWSDATSVFLEMGGPSGEAGNTQLQLAWVSGQLRYVHKYGAASTAQSINMPGALPLYTSVVFALKKVTASKRLYVYQNGTLLDSFPYINEVTGGSSADIYVGSNASGGLAGVQIKDVAFYPVGLTDAQIAAIAQVARW